MGRGLIVVGVVIVALAGALAVAVANLGRFVGANREWLGAQVRSELGRSVTFGDVGVSFRGGFGVRIADVRVADDPRFGGEFLRADEVGVTVRLLPALLGRYEIGRITLRAPVVTVIRDAAGWNVDSLGKAPRRRHPRRRSTARDAPERLPLVVIGLLDVRDGEVRYVDQRTQPPRGLVARRLYVSASDAALERPIAIEATGELADAGQASLRLDGHVGPAGDPPRVRRMPLDLTFTVADLDAGALERLALLLDLPPPRDLVAAGPVSCRARAQGSIRALRLNAATDATRAEVRWGGRFSKAGDVALEAEVSAVRDGAAFVVERARLRLADAELIAGGTVRPGPPWMVDLTVDATQAPLAALAAAVPRLAGAKVGGTAAAHLTVQGAVASGALPAVNGSVSLADASVRRANDAHGLADLSATITVGDGVARLPPTRFRLGDAPAEAAATFSLAERLLTVERLAVEPFGGSMEGTGRLDFRDAGRPRFAVNATVRNVALGPLLAARQARLAQHVEGRVDAVVALAGVGFRRERIRRTLAGDARLDVRDGVLRGVNVVDEVLGSVLGIDQAAALVPPRLRKARPDLFGAADTRFEELGATVRIAGGRARTDDLTLRTTAYTVTGRGRVGLGGDVDMTATFVAGPALTADILASVKNARWVTNEQQLVEVPFRVAGRFPDLRPRPDAAFLARAVGRALAAQARKAMRDRDKDGGLVDDALRGLQRLFER